MISSRSSGTPSRLDREQAERDLGLRHAEQPQHPLLERARWREQPAQRLGLAPPSPTSAAARRRARQHDDQRAPRSAARSARAPSRPARARSRPPARSPACGSPPASPPRCRSASARGCAAGSPGSAPRAPRRAPSRGRRSAPTTAAVRSSAVGPSPPEVITRSIRSRARKSSAERMSSARSATTMTCASSTPCSRRRSDSHGPLRSTITPDSTSVPVTTIPAREAHPVQVGRWPSGSSRGLRPGRIS